MACISLPKVPAPKLPGGITLGAALPGISFDPNLCCKLPPFLPPAPPIPLPIGTITPATIAIVTQTMAQIQTFLNSLTITCPKE